MKENLKEFELVISQGKLPWWKIIISLLFFSYMIYMLYLICFIFYRVEFEKINPKEIASLIKTMGFCLAGGISFSITKDILIDIDRDKLISVYLVGPISKKIKSTVPKLEYVSVFFNSKEQFEVNLWYIGNKHYKMYFFEDKNQAMKFAELTAIKLKIDLLDATEKGNSKWIDIPKKES